jgi:hypothetical protein
MGHDTRITALLSLSIFMEKIDDLLRIFLRELIFSSPPSSKQLVYLVSSQTQTAHIILLVAGTKSYFTDQGQECSTKLQN